MFAKFKDIITQILKYENQLIGTVEKYKGMCR